MITTCVLVAKVIVCTVVGPLPTPAEAAAILAPRQYVYVELPRPADRYPLPATQVSNTPWDWPAPSPARRLDGSLLTDPPWTSVTRLPRRQDERRAPRGKK